MGTFAESFVAYAQPLFDQTDGSEEQMQKAMAISQLCYNLALMSEESRDRTLTETRQSLEMNDAEFDDFRRSIVLPMIRRHQEMFPLMHRRGSTDISPSSSSPSSPSLSARPGISATAEAYPGTDRYAPCPCNSGKKYKFCCGKKGP